MNGWGAIHLTIAPDGTALPCQEARLIEMIDFPNVRNHDLAWIWRESPAIPEISRRFMDEGAMPHLRRKGKRFRRLPLSGLLLTGDAANTDPVCAKSPDRKLIDDLLAAPNARNPIAPTN